jgi:putative NADH-flavin reductase
MHLDRRSERDDPTTETNPTTVALLGATGNVGGHYARGALDAGFSLRALARDITKLSIADHSAVAAIEGDATSIDDVAQLIDGADVVVSCVGNPNKTTHIMNATANNVLEAAGRQATPPRCIFISTIGAADSSWLIGKMMELIGGKSGFADYEAADLRIRTETDVPVTLVRPYGLTDKDGKGTYKATTKVPVTFALPIARADLAKFLLDATTDPQWDGPKGVQLTGA